MSDRREAPGSPNEREDPDPRPVPPDVASDNKEGIAPVAPSDLSPPAKTSRATPPDLARAPEAAPVLAVPAREPRSNPLAEPPEIPIEVPRRRLTAQSRRDFLLFAAGIAASAAGAWWLLPDRVKARWLPAGARDRLDTLASRVGLSRANREGFLNRSLTFDDDVAEALYSKDRRVRTYGRHEVTRLPNNYHGRTPGPEMLATWSLNVSGLASSTPVRLSIDDLIKRFALHEQVTRLVCVEGWSAVAWWGGVRFADFLAAFPPASGARWAAMRSTVSLDGAGRPELYYVSIDLDTARHPQTLLATHQAGQPLMLAHGAPLRLLAPMKLGLKNIKAITDIEYTATEPADYWNERGYSKYDGL